MKRPSSLFLLLLFSGLPYGQIKAQLLFSDTILHLGYVPQGSEPQVGVYLSNRDTVIYKIKPEHICGCTAFEKSNYTIAPGEKLFLPVKYQSSGNAGEVKRGYYINYTNGKVKKRVKVSFDAIVDTVPINHKVSAAEKACYRWDRVYINAGKVPEGPPVTFRYTLYNCSDTTLIIKQVQSSCGCVTPQWSREPIQPGKTAEVKAIYSTSGRPGYSQKSLYVQLGDGGTQVLTLSCEVIPEKEFPEPVPVIK